MEPESANLTPAGDSLGATPELPSDTDRWTTQRKTAVVIAVGGDQMALDDACRRYKLSVDEFVAWERAYNRYGAPGLRATRYQIYRQTEMRKVG